MYKVLLMTEVDGVGYARKAPLGLPFPPFAGLKLELVIGETLWNFIVNNVCLVQDHCSRKWSSTIVSLETDKLDRWVAESNGQRKLLEAIRADEDWYRQ